VPQEIVLIRYFESEAMSTPFHRFAFFDEHKRIQLIWEGGVGLGVIFSLISLTLHELVFGRK